MDYQAMIKRQVSNAFKSAGNLAVTVAFKRRLTTDFSFEDGSVAITEESIPVKIIWVDSKKKSDDHDVRKRQVLLSRESVGDVNLYDSLDDNGAIWRLGAPIKDDGFVVLLEVYKEA